MARPRANPARPERMGLLMTTAQRQAVEAFAAAEGINLSEAIRRMIEKAAMPSVLDQCGCAGDGQREHKSEAQAIWRCLGS